MLLPYLKDPGYRTQKSIISFRGVNYSENVAEGQLEESKNLFSGHFPCMSPRNGRERGESYDNATAVWYKNGLLVVDGTDLIFRGQVVGTVLPGKKQFANINTKVVIMPDKVVFDTLTQDLRSMDAEYTTIAKGANFTATDTECRLYTHIGDCVEGIVGSGNIGGNDKIGQNSPYIKNGTLPFTSVYDSVAVDTATGAFVLGASWTKSNILPQSMRAGLAFVAPTLGANGITRYGRITKATKFAGSGPYYVWDKYNAVYKPKAGAVDEKWAYVFYEHYEDIIRTWGSNDYGIYYGTKPVLDSDGNVVDIEDKTELQQTWDYDSGFGSIDGKTVELNVPAGAFVCAYSTYSSQGWKTLTPFYCSDGLKAMVKADGYDREDGRRVQFGLIGSVCTGAELVKGSTSYGEVTLLQKTYPTNGAKDGYWYVLKNTYSITDAYGFDYDLIAAQDSTTLEGVGWEKSNFRAGDTVEISGCTSLPGNNKMATIRSIYVETVDNATWHGLVFDSGVFTAGVEASAVTVRRKAPNLSVICESQNRVFGAEGNTIYASALGDPTNFFTYDGLDTDSYAVAVATEGAFTGCIGYGKSVLFFKEDCLHKLLGDYPSQYALYDYKVPGLLQGSEESLWNINEVIYYHGRDGVYRYTGSSPELISSCFGLRRFTGAAAGAEGDRYYISMRDKETQRYGLWVYDTSRNIWLQEDGTQAVCFVRDGGKLYYIDAGDGSLVLVNPDSSEEEVAWSATLCRMDEVYQNKKCYSRLLLRADLEEGSWMQVEISSDDGPFTLVAITHKDKKTAVIPIQLTRCDNFRIRLSGAGNVLIRSLVREFDLLSEY